MTEPFLSEIKIVPFNFPPRGWARCDGQFLAINQNQALFALLGTTFGGNGITTFALPNLRDRVPIHFNDSHPMGEIGGAETNTLTTNEIPPHSHSIQYSAQIGNSKSPVGNARTMGVEAAGASVPYSTSMTGDMRAGLLGNAGGSQPHSNMQPYLALNFVIALQGIFPSSS